MIYILEKYCDLSEHYVVDSVWDVPCKDVKESYNLFMRAKADEMRIVVNEHWLNIMNRKDHHPHLSSEEYKQKEKEWNKILRRWNIKRYINDVLKGYKLEFETLYD